MAKRLVLFLNSAELFLSHRQHLAQGAIQEGYEVTVMVPAGPGAAEVRARGYNCAEVHLGRKSTNPINELKSLISIYRKLKELKPDILHSFTIKCVLYGTIAARILRTKKIVNTVTGLGYIFIDKGIAPAIIKSILSPLYRAAFKAKNVTFIFQNRDDFDLYVKNKWVDPKTSQLIPGTGVDIQIFKPNPTPTESIVVLYAGRYLKDKGIRELIAACKELWEQNLQFRLLMCGRIDPGNPNSLTAEDLKKWKALRNLEDLGFHTEMAPIYARAHVVCLPSYREGIPLSLIEAAACGKALLATDVPGCRDVVKDQETGLLVPAMNTHALRDALKHLISNSTLREQLSENARQMAAERFAKGPLVKRSLQVYTDNMKATG